MLDLLANLGAVLGALACGAGLYLTFVTAPLAFSLLDYGRADRFTRNAIRRGHIPIASMALAGGGLALLGGAWGAAASMALAAIGLMIARFALAPKEGTLAIERRQRKQQRVAAVASTAIFLPLLAVGSALAMAGI